VLNSGAEAAVGSSRRLAVLGTGAMGSALVEALLGAGHQVLVWNRTPANAEPVVRLGATLVSTIAEAVRDAEAVFVSVIGPEVIAPVLEAIFAARPGVLVVDMTTMAPHQTRACVEAGLVSYVTCPVFAQPRALARGEAFLLTAGAPAEADILAAVWPAIGKRRHLGDDNAVASALKLLTNYLHLTGIAQIASALATGREWGVDDDVLIDWLSTNPAVAVSVRPRMDSMLRGGDETGYAQADAVHALELAVHGASDAGTWLVGASDAVAAYAAGSPQVDVSAVVRSVAAHPPR